jgi:hypothetical protein
MRPTYLRQPALRAAVADGARGRWRAQRLARFRGRAAGRHLSRRRPLWRLQNASEPLEDRSCDAGRAHLGCNLDHTPAARASGDNCSSTAISTAAAGARQKPLPAGEGAREGAEEGFSGRTNRRGDNASVRTGGAARAYRVRFGKGEAAVSAALRISVWVSKRAFPFRNALTASQTQRLRCGGPLPRAGPAGPAPRRSRRARWRGASSSQPIAP